EQEELQGLNNRLESYVATNKALRHEREELGAELQRTREEYDGRLAAVREATAGEIADLRARLLAEGKAAAEASSRATMLGDELAQLKAATEDYDEVKDARNALQQEVARLTTALAEAKAHGKRMAEEYAAARADGDAALAQLKAVQVELEAATSDAAAYSSDLKEAHKSRDRLVASVREEATRELTDAMGAWERHTADKLKALEEELEAAYEDEIDDLRSRVEKLSTANDRLREGSEKASEEASKQAAFASTLMGRLKEAEDAYNRAEASWAREKANLEASLASEAAALAAKEDDFNNLMDVKIRLNQEIEHYRRILEDEEARFGITSPPHPTAALGGSKRPRDPAAGARQPPAKSTRSATAGAISHIDHPELDAHGGHFLRSVGDEVPKGVDGVEVDLDVFADRVGIVNDTGADINLEGWSLTSRGGQHYVFPAGRVLKPGQRLQVWSGPQAKAEARSSSSNLFWTSRYVWANTGDVAVLRDDEGFEVARASSDAAPAPAAAAAGGAGAAGPQDGDPGGCAMM
ncbi:LMNA, partial [Symbiodinium sp. KB8]